jgi:hypothetical protein
MLEVNYIRMHMNAKGHGNLESYLAAIKEQR